jgi:hypothetical protein
VRVARNVRDNDLVQLIRNLEVVGSTPAGGSNEEFPVRAEARAMKAAVEAAANEYFPSDRKPAPITAS